MPGSDATTYNFGTSGTYLVKATAIFQGNGWMFTSDSTSGYVCISLNGDTGYIAQKITSNTGIYCRAVILEYTKEAW